MALPYIAHAPGALQRPTWTQTVRMRLTSPAMRLAGTLVLLVVLGVATGQFLGHLLATGIENLLDVIDLDQAG